MQDYVKVYIEQPDGTLKPVYIASWLVSHAEMPTKTADKWIVEGKGGKHAKSGNVVLPKAPRLHNRNRGNR